MSLSATNSVPPQVPIPVDQETRPWPYDTARSTGTSCTPLLAAILAADTHNMVASGPGSDFRSVEEHIRGVRPWLDAEDRTLKSLVFWVYPEGLSGPYHETEDGQVKEHGLLVTIERGTKVADMMEAVKGAFVEEGTAHVHVPAV
ncbi:uncharacterized protein B0H18DRAFT_264416 [Fomitopsis serialis]|uniref:uncharacterized protein n=1 Tax=Fomitopsis serialis TaxID=139415 RepID=UPI00200737FE|nr:uncharacterized protein B0H18DRAFT_264416 [Neoantrodia serialis]KAH9928167.1 hypothetical protein B0H18DRAFT_264416 [Neoantrodia serialis]